MHKQQEKKSHIKIATFKWTRNPKQSLSMHTLQTIYHNPLWSNIFPLRQVTHINLEVFTAQLRVALSTHNMSGRAIFNRYQANAQTSYSSLDDLLTAYPTSVTDLWSMSVRWARCVYNFLLNSALGKLFI